MAVQLQRHLFTVNQFQRMGEAGIFTEDDRVELIEGEIVQMTPIGSRDAGCVAWLTAAFTRFQDRCVVWVQNPIRLGRRSEPQPDLVLLKPRDDFYRAAHPEPQDLLLVVEVADTSQEFDRGIKVPLYAHTGIPEVWLVELAAESVEVYRRPAPEGYQEVESIQRGLSLACQSVPGLELAVDEILG
ncbi:Uma2 family endonuclease [Acidobacteria bacterium AH-259-L09]|nr:Uma2 family endonuclease [Acidobacteria bacterium AH-259-L09]